MKTLRTGLQTPSGSEGILLEQVCNLLRNVFEMKTLRTGLQTPSGSEGILLEQVCNLLRNVFEMKTLRTGLQTRPAAKTCSVTYENVTDGVANPVRPRKTLRTELQTQCH
jgi:hypothetical protein